MTRPKGSLNKIQRPKTKRAKKPRQKKVSDYQTLKDLKAIARERGVKLKCNASRSEIRETLEMEPIEIPTRYDHCKGRKHAQVIIKTNMDTGEKTRYKSIFELANSLKLFAGSITYRIKKGKSLVVNGVTYTFRKDECKDDEKRLV